MFSHLRFIYSIIISIGIIVGMGSCSTTSKIPEGEYLYTGIKKINFAKDSVKISGDVRAAITSSVDVAPNNYWKLMSWRYPFPLGLWVYNHWENPSKGLKHWLYEKLVEEPVLISDVRPQVRTHMIEQILNNNGYFRGTASYSLINQRNPKKAKIEYNISAGPAFRIDSVELLPDDSKFHHIVDSIAVRDSYLSAKRPQYCTDSLSAARIRITNELRNNGYYFFAPEYIEYLADSIANPGNIRLRLTIASNTPRMATSLYRTGNITIHLNRYQGGGTPDTIKTQRATLIRMNPSRFRNELIDENIAFRSGKTFSVRNMNRTQSNLSRLGIFNSISIEAKPDSTVENKDLLNVDIFATFDAPLEMSLEANISSKSNSYIGPGLAVGVTNKNLFGGGEQLSVKVNGSYEWMTGSGSNSSMNSYEAGITGSLAFPRLLAPKFIPRSRFILNWTKFQLNAELLNRPHYFKMAQFNASINYDWRVNRYAANSLTLFKLTYTNLINTTAEFDSIMTANPAIAQSFKSQFIPQMTYTYSYDRQFDYYNSLNWTISVTEAGNIFWSIYRAAGTSGEKSLFGTPFSQFVKGSAQLVYNRRLAYGEHWLVSRLAVGAAHAYGNSSEVPYSEQFYIGGANSIRAFAVRSIGPGSYMPADGSADNFFDRTGTFKFEANVEYRFPITGPLHGALFMDAGNIWLLKNDPLRPGGQLKARSFFRDLALGTGVGLRFDISMLVIRGDLGIGIHAPYNTGRSGYYNMESFRKSLAFHLAIGYPF